MSIVIKKLIKVFLIALTCFGLFISFGNLSFAQTIDRAQLEKELKELEAEMDLHKKNIQDRQKDGKSLQRDISILDSKIKKTEIEIKLRSKNIKNIAYSIQDKNSKIESLNEKLDRERVIIKDVLKTIESKSADNFILNFLADGSLSKSVDNLYYANNLKASMVTSLDNSKNLKNNLEDIKQDLENTKSEEESLKSEQLIQKNEIEDNKLEKKEVLKETKGQEKLYQDLLKNTEKRAKEIRSKLFSFADGSQVNFGNLYNYAKSASAATGVRTEFILAILEQESSFGTNVGQCYVSDSSGSLIGITSGSSKGNMRPDSVSPFFSITSALGRDANKTRVSCALSYGYGGAMGMSQFMPATWVGYEAKIHNALGVSVADPWNAAHAIMGTGYLLLDNKAGSQTYEAERNAACKYYSGGSCSRSSAAANYGNKVMSRIQGIQNKIEVLKNN
jgi:tetrahydromethanopterin S-methyltransferase subunit G